MIITATIEFNVQPSDSRIGQAFMDLGALLSEDLEVNGPIDTDEVRHLTDEMIRKGHDVAEADYFRVE